MHPAIRKIFDDAGATAEDIAVLEQLGATVKQETLDAIASAAECLPAHLAEASAVYFARVIEATMLERYAHWKTDDPPEA